MFPELTVFAECCFDLKNLFTKAIFGNSETLGTRKYSFKRMAERFAKALKDELKLKNYHSYEYTFIDGAANQSGTIVIESSYFKVTICQDVNQPINDVKYNLFELDFRDSLSIDDVDNLLDILRHHEIEDYTEDSEEEFDEFEPQKRELIKVA